MKFEGPMSAAWAPLGRLIARLNDRHAHQSIWTVTLCGLAAASEGAGILLLIPLLALVGISAGAPSQGLGVPGLDVLTTQADIYFVLALFLGLLTLRQLIVYRQQIELNQIGLATAHSLREDLFEALTAAEWRHFSSGASHRQTQLLTLECHRAGIATQQLFVLANALFLAMMQMAVAAWLSLPFTLAAVGGLILFIVFFRDRLANAGRFGQALTDQYKSLYAMTSNFLPMLRTAKMAGSTPMLATRFGAHSAQIVDTIRQYKSAQASSIVWMQLTAAFALSIALVVGVQFLALDALRASVLILIFARLTPSLSSAQQMIQDVAHNLPAVTTVLDSIGLWRNRAETGLSSAGVVLLPPREVIELRTVTGGYADTADAQFLKEVTLRFPVGTMTLVSGATGSGKSTLADLVAGLLQPTSGSILLDGRVLSPREIVEWRKHVGYVEQAAALFTGTLIENLSWGSDAVDAAWLERVLWATAVDEFIAVVDGGLSGSVGEAGARLSGGQRQRLALARELLRKPRFLILDEATSGLDEETEGRVLARLSGLDDELTIMLISHRSTASRYVDQIVVLEHGRVARTHYVSDGKYPIHGVGT